MPARMCVVRTLLEYTVRTGGTVKPSILPLQFRVVSYSSKADIDLKNINNGATFFDAKR